MCSHVLSLCRVKTTCILCDVMSAVDPLVHCEDADGILKQCSTAVQCDNA